MGLAIVRGIAGSLPDREIVVVEAHAQRRESLRASDALSPVEELALAERDFVILAIPPQAFSDFAEVNRKHFDSATPVLSVMAGLGARQIAAALGTTQVVRSIPNTPSEVFSGMSVYFAGPQVADEVIREADTLLCAIGKALRVDSEDLVDDATALCGGGPAFVSYIVDAFCQFAASRGFSESAGREMAVQVFGGTATLIGASGRAPMQLCREVMTPNGTTERGIAAFDAAGLQATVLTALTASATRSRELAAMAAGSGGGATDD